MGLYRDHGKENGKNRIIIGYIWIFPEITWATRDVWIGGMLRGLLRGVASGFASGIASGFASGFASSYVAKQI